MIQPERKVVTKLYLREISGVTTPSQHEENRPMSHFETLLKSRTEKFGETQSEAFKKLLDDPENSGLADAYARDEQDDAKRLREAQARVDY
jgi:hypothetical protein